MTLISNIDFHCHTKASDGSYSPQEVVERAFRRGLNYLAITDHDLVSGVDMATEEAKRLNALLDANSADAPKEDYTPENAEVHGAIERIHKLHPALDSYKERIENFKKDDVTKLILSPYDDEVHLNRSNAERKLTIIPGIEFSTTWNDEQIHIVGLYVDTNNESLKKLVEKRLISRHTRAEAIGRKLEAKGFARPYERCKERAQPGAVITRGNYAKLIFEDGKARTIDEAFHKYLRRGQCAYVKTDWGPIDETVAAIHDAGGVAVVAHPRRYNFSNRRLRRLLEDFKAMGGEAMEVSSSQQRPIDRDYLEELCLRYDLYASLGSDFHHDGIYRDLGQNLNLSGNLKPVWALPQAERFGLGPNFKQRLISLSYHKLNLIEEDATSANGTATA